MFMCSHAEWLSQRCKSHIKVLGNVAIYLSMKTVVTPWLHWKGSRDTVVALQVLYANVTGKVQLNGTKEVISGAATFLK